VETPNSGPASHIAKDRVETLFCRRLDHLEKTCSERVELFEHLAARRVNFISFRDPRSRPSVSLTPNDP
jgi:hypothetical protein